MGKKERNVFLKGRVVSLNLNVQNVNGQNNHDNLVDQTCKEIEKKILTYDHYNLKQV